MSKQSFSLLEAIIAVGALVTSSAAVFIAWDQAQIMRTEQQAAVLPVLQLDRYEKSNGATIDVGFKVVNAGVGPAFIMSATVTQDGQKVAGYEELSALVPSGMRLDYESMSGRVLAPGAGDDALHMTWPADMMAASPQAIYTSTDGLAMEMCYCSTLGRCWVSKSSQRVHPKSVAKCDPPGKEGQF